MVRDLQGSQGVTAATTAAGDTSTINTPESTAVPFSWFTVNGILFSRAHNQLTALQSNEGPLAGRLLEASCRRIRCEANNQKLDPLQRAEKKPGLRPEQKQLGGPTEDHICYITGQWFVLLYTVKYDSTNVTANTPSVSIVLVCSHTHTHTLPPG